MDNITLKMRIKCIQDNYSDINKRTKRINKLLLRNGIQATHFYDFGYAIRLFVMSFNNKYTLSFLYSIDEDNTKKYINYDVTKNSLFINKDFDITKFLESKTKKPYYTLIELYYDDYKQLIDDYIKLLLMKV